MVHQTIPEKSNTVTHEEKYHLYKIDIILF